MKKVFAIGSFLSIINIALPVFAQQTGTIDSFRISTGIKVTIDRPNNFTEAKETIVCFYALPNGNSTDQTMGKLLKPGDDWHFDIQHISAQTAFIRNRFKHKNFVVIYLENTLKSWPAWKAQHAADFKILIPHLVDSLTALINARHKEIYLSGHSGGGSFVFGYLASVKQIPTIVKRISFLDSEYGYDEQYHAILQTWLTKVRGVALTVFAYNDSIALYNGKPIVSATGGTWYRSHLMLKDLQQDHSFEMKETDSLVTYQTSNRKISFFFKKNMDRGIYHTQQVERNGFIHSILCGTKNDSKGYEYYGARAYQQYIK